ncbi:hypothetical protein ACQR09_02425 [Bradyrhizobium oligotrophicum]
MPRLHWIDLPTPGRLAIAARPRAEDWLDDDIAAWARERIAVVASLLEPAEADELGLQREPALPVTRHGLCVVPDPRPRSA